MSRKRLDLNIEEIRNAVENTDSMKHAADLLGATYSSFSRYAKKFGLYKPNQGGKGRSKPKTPGNGKRSLDEILKKNTHYKSAALKRRLFEAGLKKEKCEECGLGVTWNGKPLVLHLDHVDGDSSNNLLSNLRILCPNCHSQTSTYCRGQFRSGKKTLI